jgi:hypothetical protein
VCIWLLVSGSWFCPTPSGGGREGTGGDKIIKMMDLITLVIIWDLNMHTYTIMNIVGEAIVYTKYTVDRYRGEWVDLLIDLTRVAGKGQQTRG